MAETDPMTVSERRKYIHKIWGGTETAQGRKTANFSMKQKKLPACTENPFCVFWTGASPESRGPQTGQIAMVRLWRMRSGR